MSRGANLISKMNPDRRPFFSTEFGGAYLGDARELMAELPSRSVQLVLTSPPYALQQPKEYSNVSPDEYIDWFMPFAKQILRILKDDGSFVLNIGGSWDSGKPVRSTYQFELLLSLANLFYFAQDFYWFNSAKLPTPAEWVTIRRTRAKDAVEYLWWFSKTPNPKADNSQILKPYSSAMQELLATQSYNSGNRPSGHSISDDFGKDNSGAIPPNFILCGNTASNTTYLRRCRELALSPHPARFPRAIPDLFIRFLTEEGDTVLDPFAGSCLAGQVAQELGRRWICFEQDADYLFGAGLRFDIHRVP